mgnify:CR=1 FL=1
MGGFSFPKIVNKMANPDQKTILLEQAFDDIKEVCIKFQEDSGATDKEVKILLRELARVWDQQEQYQHD